MPTMGKPLAFVSNRVRQYSDFHRAVVHLAGLGSGPMFLQRLLSAGFRVTILTLQSDLPSFIADQRPSKEEGRPQKNPLTLQHVNAFAQIRAKLTLSFSNSSMTFW